MRLGGLGIICIPIAIRALFKPKNNILWVVFFSAFCASSVISFSTFNLQPGHFFLIIMVISLMLCMHTNRECLIVKKPNCFLTLFIIVALVSIIVAVVFNIDEMVIGIGNNNQLKSSKVSTQNFTQYLYLLFGFVFYWLTYNFCIKKPEQWIQVVRIFGISGCVVLTIGIYQLIANYFNLPFDSIFRNDVNRMWQTKLRVQATMNEASFFGQYCVYLLVIYLNFPLTKKKIINILLVIFATIMGILSTSSTFFLGAIIVFITQLFLIKKTRKFIQKIFISTCVAMISSIYLYRTNRYIQILFNRTINKLMLSDRSGIERSYIFKHMISVGLKYPILGIGYGGGRSTDLYANLLSNVGFVGCIIFFAFVIQALIILFKQRITVEARMCLALLVTFFITSCSIPDLTYLPIWCLFALIDSQCYFLKRNIYVIQRNKNSEKKDCFLKERKNV